MQIFNQSKGLLWVKNKGVTFKVRSSIKIPRTPRSGIGQSLTVTEYSIIFTQCTWNLSIYKSILISLSLIVWPCYWSGSLVIAYDTKKEILLWSIVLLDIFVIVVSNKRFVKVIQSRTIPLEDSCIKWVSVQNIISSERI